MASEVAPETVREAVRAVLNEPSYSVHAQRLREEMAALPGPEYAVALLERLAMERQPIVAASAGETAAVSWPGTSRS